MKKILALTPTYFPMMGGAERTVDEIYKRIQKWGYETDLVTPNLGGKKYEKIGKFRIHRVGKKTSNRILKFILYQWYQYRKIKELLKKKKFDLVNINYGFTSILVHWWLRKTKIPIVVTEFHLGTGMDIIKASENPWYVEKFLKWAYKHCEGITVISNDQRKFVEKVSGRKDIEVVFQGTDQNYFHPKKYDEKVKKKYNVNGPCLLTVSRLNKRKNIADQVRAMKLIIKKFPKAKLLIVGKGEERENLEAMIKKMNLEKNIQFTGFVPDETLPKLYAVADIFLLTSKFEGFGIVNAEALSAGTPVITYDTAAAKDFIVEGKTGFVTKHNYKEFANKVIKLLSNKTLLRKMSKQAREELLKKYTWDIYTKQHKKFFDKVIKNVSNN